MVVVLDEVRTHGCNARASAMLMLELVKCCSNMKRRPHDEKTLDEDCKRIFTILDIVDLLLFNNICTTPCSYSATDFLSTVWCHQLSIFLVLL